VIEGTLFNVFTVVVGSLLGLLVRSRLPQGMTALVFQSLGLFTLFLGVYLGFKTEGSWLVIVFSLVLGSILGYSLRLEERINAFGDYLKVKIKSDNAQFTEGLVTAFLLFCVGPMAIMGAIEDGLGRSWDLLFTKSIMDGFSSMALASGFGVGVLLSVVPMFLFQGSISLFAIYLEPFLSESMINELTAVGGILLIGLAFNILEIKKVGVLNMLPALLFVPVMIKLMEVLSGSLL